MDLTQIPRKLGELTHAHFYVGISRVRTKDHLRVLPTPDGRLPDLSHLLNLRVNPMLRAWVAGLDPNGFWQAERMTDHWYQQPGNGQESTERSETPTTPSRRRSRPGDSSSSTDGAERQPPRRRHRPTPQDDQQPRTPTSHTGVTPQRGQTQSQSRLVPHQTQSWLFVPMLRQIFGYPPGNGYDELVTAFDAYAETVNGARWNELCDSYAALYVALGPPEIPWRGGPGVYVDANVQVQLLDPFSVQDRPNVAAEAVPALALIAEVWQRQVVPFAAAHTEQLSHLFR